MRWFAPLSALVLLSLVGGACAKIEHVSDIGSESEQVTFCVYVEKDQSRLVEGGYDLLPGENRVLVGYWLRPGGSAGRQFREEVRIEFRPGTGEIVQGVWDSSFYETHAPAALDQDRDTNRIIPADENGRAKSAIVLSDSDGGTGWMTLVLAKEWWRTTRVVQIWFRKETVPSRFPAG